MESWWDIRLASLLAGSSGHDVIARGWVPAKIFEYLATDRPIIYLGDPASDAAALLDRLDDVLRDKTVIHITHRPGEAERADLVLDVADGRMRARAYR